MKTIADSNSAVPKILGRQIRKYRLLAGMTQEDLAHSSGIYRTYLSRVEHGIANPTLSVLAAIAKSLKINLWDFMCE